MHSFLYRASDAENGCVHARVEAADLRDARRQLEARGLRDIEFYHDEHQADLTRLVGGLGPDDPASFSPLEEVALAGHQGRGVGWWLARQHLVILGPLLLWSGFALNDGAPYNPWEIAAFVATPLYFAYAMGLSMPLFTFTQLLHAGVECDWGRQRRWIGWARRLRRWFRAPIPESELVVREAHSLAAQGDLDGALQVMEGWRGRENVPGYLYFSRIAICYELAGRYDEMVHCLIEAQVSGPGGASEWIDLGNALVLRKRDLEGAKSCFDAARELELPVLARAALALGEGALAVEKGRWMSARSSLHEALTGMMSYAGNPLTRVFAMEAHAYLALAEAGSGHRDRAAHYAELARPLLERRHETELLHRIQLALR